MGSPSFMAPEAWTGVSDLLDQRADVYALGVILFRVLAGELPFSGDSLKEKFLNTTTSARPSLRKYRPDLPADAEQWVALALAIDREQRFANVRALWNVFLSVFHVEVPNRGQRESLWAAAKGVAQKLVRGSQPAPAHAPPAPPAPAPSSNEPSFAREALARSVFRTVTPTDEAVPETTLELSDTDLEPAGPPPRKPSAPPAVERTLSMSDADIVFEPPPKK